MTNSPHEKRTGLPPHQSIVTEVRGDCNVLVTLRRDQEVLTDVLVTLRRDETVLTTEREEYMAEKGRDFQSAML